MVGIIDRAGSRIDHLGLRAGGRQSLKAVDDGCQRRVVELRGTYRMSDVARLQLSLPGGNAAE